MATIVQRNGNDYLFEFSKPETEWIAELARSMGITKESVAIAAMNKGLTYYVETFHTHVMIDKVKDLLQDELDRSTNDAKDHKTYDKGSCQG